jgi:hypothetical protein
MGMDIHRHFYGRERVVNYGTAYPEIVHLSSFIDHILINLNCPEQIELAGHICRINGIILEYGRFYPDYSIFPVMQISQKMRSDITRIRMWVKVYEEFIRENADLFARREVDERRLLTVILSSRSSEEFREKLQDAEKVLEKSGRCFKTDWEVRTFQSFPKNGSRGKVSERILEWKDVGRYRRKLAGRIRENGGRAPFLVHTGGSYFGSINDGVYTLYSAEGYVPSIPLYLEGVRELIRNEKGVIFVLGGNYKLFENVETEAIIVEIPSVHSIPQPYIRESCTYPRYEKWAPVIRDMQRMGVRTISPFGGEMTRFAIEEDGYRVMGGEDSIGCVGIALDILSKFFPVEVQTQLCGGRRRDIYAIHETHYTVGEYRELAMGSKSTLNRNFFTVLAVISTVALLYFLWHYFFAKIAFLGWSGGDIKIKRLVGGLIFCCLAVVSQAGRFAGFYHDGDKGNEADRDEESFLDKQLADEMCMVLQYIDDGDLELPEDDLSFLLLMRDEYEKEGTFPEENRDELETIIEGSWDELDEEDDFTPDVFTRDVDPEFTGDLDQEMEMALPVGNWRGAQKWLKWVIYSFDNNVKTYVRHEGQEFSLPEQLSNNLGSITVRYMGGIRGYIEEAKRNIDFLIRLHNIKCASNIKYRTDDTAYS